MLIIIIPESFKPDYVVEFLQGRHLYYCQKIRITYAKLYDIKRFIYFNFFLGIINVLSTQIQSGPPPASHRATINVNLIQNIEDSYETAITCLLQLYNSTIKKKHRKSLPVIFLVLKILLNWIYLNITIDLGSNCILKFNISATYWCYYCCFNFSGKNLTLSLLHLDNKSQYFIKRLLFLNFALS